MTPRGRAGSPWTAESTPSGARGGLRRFPTPNLHERIHAATARAVAEAGYEETGVEAICALAEISTECFQAHFANKREAVLSAVEAIADCVMADCQAAFVAAPSWPQAVWATSTTITDWGACEPCFARLAVVEMMGAGPPAQELMRSLIDAFALFLAPGYRFSGREGLAIGSLDSAIGTQLLALLRDHIERDSPQTLPSLAPELARAALSPFLGAAEAERFVADRLTAERGRAQPPAAARRR